MLSGALVSTLIGLAASNLGVISCEAKAYPIVLEYLLPLAVPLLLFRADLFRVVRSTGKLLLAFLIGSGNIVTDKLQFHRLLITMIDPTLTLIFALPIHLVATTIGTVVAYWMVPMRPLGQEGWKIAAALMGRHIGGGNEHCN